MDQSIVLIANYLIKLEKSCFAVAHFLNVYAAAYSRIYVGQFYREIISIRVHFVTLHVHAYGILISGVFTNIVLYWKYTNSLHVKDMTGILRNRLLFHSAYVLF